jgi:hypothetical protein
LNANQRNLQEKQTQGPSTRAFALAQDDNDRKLLAGLEVLIEEDVGCGADQLEANAVAACLAWREVVTADHYRLVAGAVLSVVYDLVNAGLANGIARPVVPASAAAAAARRTWWQVMLQRKLRPCERVHHERSPFQCRFL